MVLLSTIDLSEMTFRANPQYELICVDEPEGSASDIAEAPAVGEDFYGFFQPRGASRLKRRQASAATALLFLSLLQPRKLPRRFATARTSKEQVARLVFDDVLEVEYGGHFVSGAKAGHLLTGTDLSTVNHLGRLSIEALQYAQHLAGLPDKIIAHRLYLYGALPATAALHRRYPDDESVLRHVVNTASLPSHVEKYWMEEAPRPGRDRHWRKWFFRGGSRQREPRFKLYISPTISGLRDIAGITAETLLNVDGIFGFKIGRDVETICRPDKMVAYFDDRDALRLAADLLTGRLVGRPAHGVPFSSQISDDGLLSWGADPPTPDASENPESWRYWIVTKLARYLTAAEPHSEALEPWEFAIQRLKLAGIDTDRWTPPPGAWSLTFANS